MGTLVSTREAFSEPQLVDSSTAPFQLLLSSLRRRGFAVVSE